MRFCLDTSAFIDAWERYYAPDVFPIVWEEIDDLVKNGVICAPEEVWHEMKKKSDGVFQWARARKGLFIPLRTEVQASLRRIMAEFREGFVDPRTSRSGADPLVIAVALTHGDTVVSGERSSGSTRKPRIPDVCRHFGVECCTVLEMFRKLNVAF